VFDITSSAPSDKDILDRILTKEFTLKCPSIIVKGQMLVGFDEAFCKQALFFGNSASHPPHTPTRPPLLRRTSQRLVEIANTAISPRKARDHTTDGGYMEF